MCRHTLPLFALLVGLFAGETLVGGRPLLAQGAPDHKKKYDELIQSAKRNEMIGYLAAGAAILFVVLAIPVSIYVERRKKARQKAAEDEKGAGST